MRFIFLLFYIANGQMPGQFRPQMFEEKKETSESSEDRPEVVNKEAIA